MSINKAALDQAAAARKKYRSDTPQSLYSIEGEDAVFVAAYLEAIKVAEQPARCKHGVWPYDHCYFCEDEAKTQQPDDCAELQSLIHIWSMRPQPGTPEGDAWEHGCKQGYRWGLERRKQPVRESGWQPIETAPNDGRYILGWSKKKDQVRIIFWNVCIWMGLGHRIEPTHWMPLPEPPTDIEGDK